MLLCHQLLQIYLFAIDLRIIDSDATHNIGYLKSFDCRGEIEIEEAICLQTNWIDHSWENPTTTENRSTCRSCRWTSIIPHWEWFG